jgi:hypothetical protein
MARKMKPVKPGKPRVKKMGGSSRKVTWTKRQLEALRRLNQDFSW